MKINELLREAVEDLVKKLKPFYEHATENRQKYAIKALGVLQAGLEKGVIFNADFGETKGQLGYAYESSLDEIEKELISKDTDREFLRQLYQWDIRLSYPSIHTSPKLLRDLEKVLKERTIEAEMKKILEKALEVHRAAVELKKIFEELKPKIVKGRKPSEASQDPNRFHQKLGSKASQDLVVKELKGGIDPRLDEFEKAMEDYFDRELKTLAKDGEFIRDDSADPMLSMMVTRCFTFKREDVYEKGYRKKHTKFTELKLNDEGKAFPKTEAKNQRDFIEKNFLYKSVNKLSHLVDLKGNLDKIVGLPRQPVVVQAGVGRVEAGFKFSFADGSSFTVINKIVSKYSYRGTPFVQYPTTFHDVVLPDGGKLKTPSEEKMVKEFATWKKP